ncbi:Protein SYM1 [Seminavis robusta]|uniref:Protein SYM1 n=1 Tax=Seminavis robusta TaxID=568900 RepID=A0A9N8HGM7_9STRA|nr:Protein SYM1 [Seminavis robusta]|eukprot:Sro405_g136170.1 Protein SYM1 (285) ;mRNA; f:39154-40008
MMWQWYKGALSRHPLAVKATTAASLMSVSDFLGQTYEQMGYQQILQKYNRSDEDKDDKSSSSKTCGVNLQNGCPNNTPQNRKALHYETTTTDNIGQTNAQLLQYNWERTLHVGITGFTFSGPISHGWYSLLEWIVVGRLGITTLYAGMATRMALDAFLFSPVAVAGYFVWRSVLEGANVQWKLQHKWLPALQASFSFWPLANVINFGLVPVPFRVLYNNALSLLWNAYLSNVNQGRLEVVVEQQQQQQPSTVFDEGTSAVADSNNHEIPFEGACVCWHCRALRG